jgi:Fe-S-cluster containining protein
MSDSDTSDSDTGSEPALDAGNFAAWLAEMQAALRGDQPSNVPCGSCTACCTASQFIHIAPDESDTLAHIPAELLFAAPRLPVGHVLMGYDQHGHCPMLVDNQCSIYAHRPRTCRTYDCRVFPASGLQPDDDDATKVLIAERARRWRFDFPTDRDLAEFNAVRAAVAYIERNTAQPPNELAPKNAAKPNTTQVAVRAIETFNSFLEPDDA